ncbi:MAG: MFS transporter [Rhodocyclaceae bacterium]|nr:MFS transporter [Rhodocyclaceae bacterium]
MPMKHLLRALGQRNFRVYFIGQSASLVGTWMQQIALAWLVYRLTGSPFMLGLASFVGHIPILFLAPLGGLWADRFDRRRSMLVTQVLSLLQAAVLAGLTFAGVVEVWHLLVAAAFLGVVNAIDTPLRQSFLLELVGSREHLTNAIALNSLMMNVSRLVGPPIAGVVLALAGEAWCFTINALSYLAVIASLAAIRLTGVPRKPHTQGWLAGLKEAAQFAWHFLPTRAMLTLVALVSFFANPYASLMPVFARDIFAGGADLLGILVGAGSVGAVTGVLYLASRKHVAGLEALVPVAAGCAGLGLLVFSQSPWFGLSLAVLPLVGFGIMVNTASANMILQSVVPDHLRGRLVSFHVMAFLGIAPMGHFAAGWIAEHFGARVALAIGGLACLLGAAWFAARLQRLRAVLEPLHAQQK